MAGGIKCSNSYLSDPPVVSVDKLYLSQHGGLTLELVCSAQSNPPASLAWSRLDVSTGEWREVSELREEEGQDRGENTGVWSLHRQVRLH